MHLPKNLVDILDAKIVVHQLDDFADVIRAAARQCIYLHLGESDEGQLGESRVGGTPDLPASIPWPRTAEDRYLNFVMQLNLGAIAAIAQTELPPAGTLYFFIESDESCLNVRHRILFAAPGEKLSRVIRSPAEQFVANHYTDLAPHTVRLIHGIDLPSYGSRLAGELEDQSYDAAERYYALRDSLDHADGKPDLKMGKVLGYLSEVQGDLASDVALIALGKPRVVYATHESLDEFDAETSALISVGRTTPELRREVREQLAWFHANQTAFLAEKANWRLLWQIESNFDVGLLIWDAGTFNILIRDSDLRTRSFDRTFAAIESS